MKDIVDVWITVSVDGALRTGDTCVPTVTVMVVVCVREPLIPDTTIV